MKMAMPARTHLLFSRKIYFQLNMGVSLSWLLVQRPVESEAHRDYSCHWKQFLFWYMFIVDEDSLRTEGSKSQERLSRTFFFTLFT